MSKKYHVNDNGVAGVCEAKIQCDFGADVPHYDTKEEAALAYEKKMNGETFNKVERKPRQAAKSRTKVEASNETLSEENFINIPQSKPIDQTDVSDDELIDKLEKSRDQEIEDISRDGARKLQLGIDKEIFNTEEEIRKLVKASIESSLRGNMNGAPTSAYEVNLNFRLDNLREHVELLKKDHESLNNYKDSDVTEIRESIAVQGFRKRIGNLLNDTQNTIGLRTIGERVSPTRLNGESDRKYKKRMAKANYSNPRNAKPWSLTDTFNDMKMQHDELNKAIELENKAKSEYTRPEHELKLQAKAKAVKEQSTKDAENIKRYNSFGNRFRRGFIGSNKTIMDRKSLERVAIGNKAVDYNSVGENGMKEVWTKVSENKWVSENNNVSTDLDRQLPVQIVK